MAEKNDNERLIKYSKHFDFKWDETTELGRIALTSIVNDAYYAYEYARYFKFQWGTWL